MAGLIVYEDQDVIPLEYERPNALGVAQTGLSVSVVVKSTVDESVLLASTTLTEKVAGSGLYSYFWTHNLPKGGSCVALFSVGGRTIREYFMITYPSGGSAR